MPNPPSQERTLALLQNAVKIAELGLATARFNLASFEGDDAETRRIGKEVKWLEEWVGGSPRLQPGRKEGEARRAAGAQPRIIL